jgi:hypothetical protein
MDSLTLAAEGCDGEEVAQAVPHGTPGVTPRSNSYMVSILIVTDLRLKL